MTEVDMLWARTYPLETSEPGWWAADGPSVQETQDGGFIVAATIIEWEEDNLFLLKTDSRGDTLWSHSYHIPALGGSATVQQLRDGGYAVCGGCYGFNTTWGFLMRLDAEGDSLWTQSTYDNNRCVQETADGGFVMAGYGCVGCTMPCWASLTKTDDEGEIEWWRTWPGESYFHHVVELRDGSGYAMVGWRSTPLSGEVYFVKTDLDGFEVANGSYREDDFAWGSELLETSQGDFLICGGSGYDAYLIRADVNGSPIWAKEYQAVPRMLYLGDVKDPTLPGIIGSVDAHGDARAVATDGRYLYVAGRHGNEGLHVIDASARPSPVVKGSAATPDQARDVVVVGKHAYVPAGYSLNVVDVMDPGLPEIVGSVEIPDCPAQGVAVVRDYAYVVTSSTLEVVDISDPTSPERVGKVEGAGGMNVAVEGNCAYVASGSYRLKVVDVSVPSSPELVGSFHMQTFVFDVAIEGNCAYIAGNTGLLVVDVSDPTSPETIVTVCTTHWAEGVVVTADYIYLATHEGLEVVDLSTEPPRIVGNVSVPGKCVDVAVTAGNAYLATQTTSTVARSVVETPQDGFLVAGQGLGRVWLLETDSAGDTLWSTSFDVSSDTEYAQRIRPTADGGYILCGGARSRFEEEYSILLMRLGAPDTHVFSLTAAKPYTALLQANVPNPFNPTTTIHFYVPEPEGVLLQVYEPSGRLVRTLVEERRPAGIHSVTWDGTNQSGAPVAGGVYFYQLMMNGEKLTRRMTLLR
jgi:hypothetical protein